MVNFHVADGSCGTAQKCYPAVYYRLVSESSDGDETDISEVNIWNDQAKMIIAKEIKSKISIN